MSGSETVYYCYFFRDTIYVACLFGSRCVRITFLNAFILAISVSGKDILVCCFNRWRTVRKAFNNSSEYSWANFSVQIFSLPKMHFWSTEAVCSLKSLGLVVNNALSQEKKNNSQAELLGVLPPSNWTDWTTLCQKQWWCSPVAAKSCSFPCLVTVLIWPHCNVLPKALTLAKFYHYFMFWGRWEQEEIVKLEQSHPSWWCLTAC